MALRLRIETDRLKQDLLALCVLVKGLLADAIQAVRERNTEIARRVIERDAEVNEKEVDLEEECLKILALHQPVAVDLRVIVAVLKINNDLERIGDLAGHIAARAIDLSEFPDVEIPQELTTMTEITQEMLDKALRSLLESNEALAQEVLPMDDRVDGINRGMYERTYQVVNARPGTAKHAITILSVSRYLERVRDLATNIAEDVIYMIEGRIVRHEWE